ncbi:protease HtpX [Streptomyces scabiei]|uniref:Protease HtpX n=1 Tax=Streptomyces scabiei TaxID=1930 RepID=A0A100JJK6_STRSC|nr:protease HtpX [Streptomyces scabiei]
MAGVTETPLADARAAAVPARPAQLTSPTRGHYLLLMVVLAVAGITAGALVFNEVHGTAWLRAQLACTESVGPLPGDPQEWLRLQIQYLSCVAPAERQRAAAGFAGGAAVVALGLALTWWLPRRLIRRIGPLTAPPPRWPSPGPPVLLGGPELVEPFTVQHLGTPHIVMPRGARRLPAAEVAAALRHECAHVAAGDVRLAWLVRGLRRALPVVAVLPVLVTTVAALAGPDRSVFGSLFSWVWLDYGARVALLAVAAWIIGARIGRAREHEADSRAAADGAGSGLTALLERAEAGPRLLRERLAGTHPTPRQRLAHLGNRTPPAVLGRLDELVAGVLAVTVLTTSYQVTTPAFTATPVAGWTLAIDALLAGALLAVACGPAWWHQPPPDARAPWWHRAGACLTVPSAVPVGLYIGVDRTGATGDGPYGSWWVLLTLSLATAGATAICVSLARVWWRADRVGGWMVPLLATTILYGLAFWIGTTASLFVWLFRPSHYLTLVANAPWAGSLAVFAALGCAFAWRLQRTAETGTAIPVAVVPRTVVPGPVVWRIPPLIVLLSAGAAAAAACTVRLRTVASVEADEKAAVQLLDMWSASAAGVAVLLALLIAGAGTVPDILRAAPPATALTFVAIYLRWATTWSDPVETARRFLVTPLAVLAVSVLLLAAFVPLLPSRARPPHRTVLYLLPPLSAGIAAALTSLLINYGGVLEYRVLLSLG